MSQGHRNFKPAEQALSFFFFIFQASGGKNEASVERESHTMGGAQKK